MSKIDEINDLNSDLLDKIKLAENYIVKKGYTLTEQGEFFSEGTNPIGSIEQDNGKLVLNVSFFNKNSFRVKEVLEYFDKVNYLQNGEIQETFDRKVESQSIVESILEETTSRISSIIDLIDKEIKKELCKISHINENLLGGVKKLKDDILHYKNYLESMEKSNNNVLKIDEIREDIDNDVEKIVDYLLFEFYINDDNSIMLKSRISYDHDYYDYIFNNKKYSFSSGDTFSLDELEPDFQIRILLDILIEIKKFREKELKSIKERVFLISEDLYTNNYY